MRHLKKSLWSLGTSFFAVATGYAQTATNGTLSATFGTNTSVTLTLQAPPNTDYAIMASTNLSTRLWTNVGSAATSPLGVLKVTDPSSSNLAQRFYRAVLSPVPTASNAIALENNNVTFALTGTDPLNTGSTLTAAITQTPSNGVLKQFSGTVITNAGTNGSIPVLDPQNRVIFSPPTNATGNPYATFSYELIRGSDGAASPTQPVAVSVNAPLPPQATLSAITDIENTPLLFALTATDPNPPPGVGGIGFNIVEPPTFGQFYQVQADNQTRGAPITNVNTTVTNGSGYLIYVPQTNVYGTNYDAFSYMATNRLSLQSALQNVPISISHVNHAPVAYSNTNYGQNNVVGLTLYLNYLDVDNDPLTVYFTSLPACGTLYLDAISTGDEIIVGQPYSGYNFLFVSAAPYDWGVPYAQCTYYVEDPGGLTSAIVTNTISIEYVVSPPVPTSPTNYTLPENTSTNITLVANDPNGDTPYWTIQTLPQYGSLFLGGVNLTNYSLPVLIPPNVPDPTLVYVPETNYNYYLSSNLPDSFTFTVADQSSSNPAVFTNFLLVTPVNQPPSINGQTTVIVTENTNGVVTADGTLTNLTIADDATETASKVFIQVQAINDTGPGVSLYTSNARGVTVTFPATNAIKIEGTVVAINVILGNNNLHYHPSSSSPAALLNFLVNDEGNPGGGTPLTATTNITVNYIQK